MKTERKRRLRACANIPLFIEETNVPLVGWFQPMNPRSVANDCKSRYLAVLGRLPHRAHKLRRHIWDRYIDIIRSVAPNDLLHFDLARGTCGVITTGCSALLLCVTSFESSDALAAGPCLSVQ